MSNTPRRPHVKACVIAVNAALAAFACVAPATAATPDDQTTASADSASPQQAVQSVVVSASRIDRAGYTAPTPTTVLSASALEERAAVNVGDVLNEMPAFRASTTPSSGAFANNSSVQADLRGLTPVRTMVLINRARLPRTVFPGQNSVAATDLSMIPTGVLRSVDVVTGGASAAYGSDAVAGVVNLVVDETLQGFNATVQGGETRYHDMRDKFVSLAGGFDFGGDKGHVTLGGEFNDNGGTSVFNDQRAWGRRNNNYFTFPGARPAGVPANLVADNVLFSTVAPGGLVQQVASNPAALRGLAFVPGANGTTTAPFNYGQSLGATTMVGGSNVPNYQLLRGPLNRKNFLAHVTYDVNDQLTVYAEPLLADFKSHNITVQRRDGGGAGPALSFKSDNYYLQSALTPAQRALVPAAGLTIGYLGNDFGPGLIDVENKVARLLVGARGKLGQGWKWDAFVQRSRSTVDQDISNIFNNANFVRAIDVVQVTAANVGSSGVPIGSVACRSTLTSPANGCQPLNILGAPSGSQAAMNYVLATATARSINGMREASASMQGEPAATWAGPVSLGFGVDWRSEDLEVTTDPLSQAAGYNTRTAAALPKVSNSVKEGYVETIVPLAKALPLAKSIDLNAAVRRTDYSTSGAVTTWKGGLTWEPISDLRFRATRSRDIRAPNLGELFTQTTITVPSPIVRDPRTGFNSSYQTTSTSGGNPELTPEISNTTTFGVVLQPSFLKRLSLSADYYRINIGSAITSSSAQTIIDSCLAGGAINASSPYCSLITFANNDPVKGAITKVSTNLANVAGFRTDGLDLQASYSQPLKEWNDNLAGTLNVNIQGTRVFEYWTSTDISAAFPNGINRAGQTGSQQGSTPPGLATWAWRNAFNYRLRKFNLNTQVRYISRSHQNNGWIGPDDANYSPTLSNSVNNNVIPSMTYVDLSASYDFGAKQRREVFFAVNNLTDRAPPLPAANTAYYDLAGRTYRFGVRVSFD
ncbi:TonB-dependent receptor domain-containing protein [Telluria sp. Tellsp104]